MVACLAVSLALIYLDLPDETERVFHRHGAMSTTYHQGSDPEDDWISSTVRADVGHPTKATDAKIFLDLERSGWSRGGGRFEPVDGLRDAWIHISPVDNDVCEFEYCRPPSLFQRVVHRVKSSVGLARAAEPER
jgi:hypothetical protein